jgi:glycosyltransferase involved in cell wall biosynthesis
MPRILAPKTKVIVTAHSEDWEHQKWNWLARTSLKLGAKFSALFAHEVLTVSRRLQKYYLTNFKRSITLIPNGVPLRENKNGEENLIANYGLEREKYILTVSRLIRHKGIHYLIEAFKEAKKRNEALADWKLVIVGQTFFTDSYFEFLKKLVDGRTDIVFAGAKRGAVLEQLYQNAYLYVSPSESEGLSISCLEAMSYGKAPLVSDISANLDLIKGDTELGSVGFTFANKNIADLATKLELLWQHQEIVRKVGNKARNYVKIYYNWNDIIDRTSHLYMTSVAVKDKLNFWELFLLKRAGA